MPEVYDSWLFEHEEQSVEELTAARSQKAKAVNVGQKATAHEGQKAAQQGYVVRESM